MMKGVIQNKEPERQYMSPAEAIRDLADVETRLHQFMMQIRIPAYGQDMLKEITNEIKSVRESIFNGFPCAEHGHCPTHQQQNKAA